MLLSPYIQASLSWAVSSFTGGCGRCMCGRCGAPAVVAFSGKRQWVELLNTGRPRAHWVKTVPLGLQTQRPEVGVGPARTSIQILHKLGVHSKVRTW